MIYPYLTHLHRPSRVASLWPLVGAAALAACSSSDTTAAPPDLEATVVAISDEAVVPAIETFASEADALQEAVATLCEAPTAELVDAARNRWRAVSIAWNRVVLYDFGPISGGITPLNAFIDSFKAFDQGRSYIETVRGDIRTFVADGADLSGEDFSTYNFQRVGLVALEVGLFETATEPPDPEAAAVADELATGTTKCGYLIGQSAVLASRAEELAQAWSGDGDDYRATFVSSTDDALGAVFVSVQSQMEYLERRSVANRAAPVSDFSYDNIGASLDELEALLTAGDDDSLRRRLEQARAPELIDDHASGLAAARNAIAARDPDALGPILVRIGSLYLDDMPDALGIRVGLNFTDGD